MRAILRRDEPEGVYRELVEGLAENVVPMVILCGVVLATGAYVLSIIDSAFVLATTAVSTVAGLIKIVLILRHQKRRLAYQSASLAEIHRLERWHAATTIAVCLSVGCLSAAIYRLPHPALHMIPVCIGFGYAAGLIARVSIRPHIAAGALTSLFFPGAIALAHSGGHHLFVAGVMTLFLGAGLQSSVFVYETARRAVMLRLQMEALARHDPLTGLLNRLGLQEAYAVLSRGRDRVVIVHAFDLDGFKAVNDAFGHAAGDRLLKVLATRIQLAVPEGSIVARTGGDEFVVVQLGNATAARRLAETIHRQLSHPCEIGVSQPVRVGLSLGFTVSRLSQAGLDALIQQADAQSYAVKREGGGVRGGNWVSQATATSVARPRMAASA